MAGCRPPCAGPAGVAVSGVDLDQVSTAESQALRSVPGKLQSKKGLLCTKGLRNPRMSRVVPGANDI